MSAGPSGGQSNRCRSISTATQSRPVDPNFGKRATSDRSDTQAATVGVDGGLLGSSKPSAGTLRIDGRILHNNCFPVARRGAGGGDLLASPSKACEKSHHAVRMILSTTPSNRRPFFVISFSPADDCFLIAMGREYLLQAPPVLRLAIPKVEINSNRKRSMLVKVHLSSETCTSKLHLYKRFVWHGRA